MSSVKLEKNKPIPERNGKNKYPWATMQIGESFITESRFPVFGSLAYFNSKQKKRKQKQIGIETRQEGDKCRVWRVK